MSRQIVRASTRVISGSDERRAIEISKNRMHALQFIDLARQKIVEYLRHYWTICNSHKSILVYYFRMRGNRISASQAMLTCDFHSEFQTEKSTTHLCYVVCCIECNSSGACTIQHVRVTSARLTAER